MSKRHVITIRAFKEVSASSAADQERRWAILEPEVISILEFSEYRHSLEDLYKVAEDMYLQKHFPLMDNLQVIIDAHLFRRTELLLTEGERFLETLEIFWRQFCSRIITVKNIFLRFDRSSKDFKYNSIQCISLSLFANIIIRNSTIRKKIVKEVLYHVDRDRNGGDINSDLLQSITTMLNVLHVYKDIFQEELLKSSQLYYEEEGNRLIGTCSVPEYLFHINQRIAREQDRAINYLGKNLECSLLEIVRKQLGECHLQEIFDKGFETLVDNSMFSELALLYKLCNQIANGQKSLVTHFKEYVIKMGCTVTSAQNEKCIIQDLLDFKDKIEKIIKISFQNKNVFHQCVRCSFDTIINGSNSQAAQHLAKYLDSKLRCKDICDDTLETVLTKATKMFKHIQGKDIFEAFYKKHLAKRLLLGKSSSQDAERSMISKLKDECGSAFTLNIEGMFKDMNLSKNINAMFKLRFLEEIQQSGNGTAGDFSVNILTSSFWPNYPSFDVHLPKELVSYQQTFQTFYLCHHSGRKLLWQPSLGHCLVKATFACGNKELQVSLFQTLILLLFNDCEDLSYKEIQGLTHLENGELKRTLLSLACGKSRVLCKSPKGKDVQEEDHFIFNKQFTDKLFRVKINQIQFQETPENEKQTERDVLTDRQFQIDAAIVRVLKSKKAIKHNMLVKELYTMLDIPVNQTDLKKRIELLIDREYMARDKDNRSNYIYLA